MRLAFRDDDETLLGQRSSRFIVPRTIDFAAAVVVGVVTVEVIVIDMDSGVKVIAIVAVAAAAAAAIVIYKQKIFCEGDYPCRCHEAAGPAGARNIEQFESWRKRGEVRKPLVGNIGASRNIQDF